jgi:hypothetical protein
MLLIRLFLNAVSCQLPDSRPHGPKRTTDLAAACSAAKALNEMLAKISRGVAHLFAQCLGNWFPDPYGLETTERLEADKRGLMWQYGKARGTGLFVRWFVVGIVVTAEIRPCCS